MANMLATNMQTRQNQSHLFIPLQLRLHLHQMARLVTITKTTTLHLAAQLHQHPIHQAPIQLPSLHLIVYPAG